MPFVLAHLSDPHLAPLPQPRRVELIGKRVTGYLNWQRRRRFMHDPAVLAEIVASLKTAAPDHIAVTGDLANIALPAEYSRGRAWLESLGDAADVTLVPGNHDIYVGAAATWAQQHWGPFMRGDDGGAGFPFVRRRGGIALVGLSTGVPTAPFLATGWLGTAQLSALQAQLVALARERVFRIVLIHHPPVTAAARHKRLLDAPILLQILRRTGAELVLHGHDHLHMLNWLDGPNGRIPAFGVPSASAAPGRDHENAGYNLLRIERDGADWKCAVEARGLTGDGSIATLSAMEFGGPLEGPERLRR